MTTLLLTEQTPFFYFIYRLFNCFIFVTLFTEINDIPLGWILFFFSHPISLVNNVSPNWRYRIDSQLNNHGREWQTTPSPMESRATLAILAALERIGPLARVVDHLPALMVVILSV